MRSPIKGLLYILKNLKLKDDTDTHKEKGIDVIIHFGKSLKKIFIVKKNMI